MRYKRILLWLLLCLLILLGACSNDSSLKQSTSEDKKLMTASATYSAFSVEQLLQMGMNVLLGRVIEKSDETYEYKSGSDEEVIWLYHEVTIEIIECWASPEDNLKAGDTMICWEFGGENDEYRFVMEGATTVNEGEEIVVFGKETMFLTPARCFKVENNRLVIPEIVLGNPKGSVKELTVTDIKEIVKNTLEEIELKPAS